MPTKNIEKPLPNAHEFYVNTSLYAKFKVTPLDDVYQLIFGLSTLDCYCVECSNVSVFIAVDKRPRDHEPYDGEYVIPEAQWSSNVENDNSIYERQYLCSRNNDHKMNFFVQLKSGYLSKVGQSTALAEIVEQDIKKYRKTLGDNHYSEFTRAVGLFSHEIGVGSFVYLRRIIENFLIKPAHERAKTDAEWDDEKYLNLRVGDKIKMLKDYLPEFLVENTKVYGIVSKGIHELTEDECKEYFPLLKSFLELVLTEIATKKVIEDRKKNVRTELEKISGKIS